MFIYLFFIRHVTHLGTAESMGSLDILSGKGGGSKASAFSPSLQRRKGKNHWFNTKGFIFFEYLNNYEKRK